MIVLAISRSAVAAFGFLCLLALMEPSSPPTSREGEPCIAGMTFDIALIEPCSPPSSREGS